MKNRLYRITSFVVAVLMAWSLITPALAESDIEYVSKDTFWNWVADNTDGLLSAIISYRSESVCTVNEDGRHRSTSYQRVKTQFGILGGSDTPYYTCICDACGQEFTAYETDLKQSYDNQVADLPATGYNSDGCLLIPYTIETHYINRYNVKNYDHVSNCNSHTLSSYESSNYVAFYSCSSNSVSFRLKSGSSFFDNSGFSYKAVLERPYDGFYVVSTPRVEASYVLIDGTQGNVVGPIGSDGYNFGSSLGTYYSAGTIDTLDDKMYISFSSGKYKFFSLTINFLPPVAKFTPAPSVDVNFNSIYNINTRPTSITGGNYGIVGDNGQINTVTNNNQIVNETNNTYYNPATGETSTITDWSYDYSDRSYNLTLEGGDTSTVTYGDENITITETTINESGDTIINNYTIYYIINGTGTGTGSENPPAVCTHNWQETRAVPATCTAPGSCLLTCSLCNQTKTETIPALGHNWQVKQTVTTQYDDTGQLIQQGYTIFECSTCHEQYKSQDGTIPPGGSGNGSGDEGEEKEGFLSWLLRKAGELLGAVGNGIISFLQSVLDGIFDGLISLVNSVFENLAQLVDLFGSFGDALGVLWTWLPPEIMVILVAGVSVFVLIALLKLFMK